MHHHMPEELSPQIKFVALGHFPTQKLGPAMAMESHRTKT